jgi:P-type E1-E2 ATPase
MVGLSVLVVACPCALGIATPAAMWMAVAAAAERGIVLRSAPVLERLARVGRILFDKTGTLTRALPQVRAVEALPGGGFAAADVLRLAAGLEADVPHPVARALVAMAGAEGVAVADADDVRLLPGRGVTGHVEGRAVTVASARGLAERGVAVDDPEQRWTWVVVDDRVVGRLLLADAVEPEVPDVLAALRARGLRLGLVTGAAHADGVVPALIDPGDAVCSASPAGKIAAVERLRGDGGVAMVGDGLNDAPALAAADVGIAVARASDLTRVAADVVLLGGGVAELPWLMTQARRTVRIARQNLAWAFAYNTVALALAAAGQLTPVVAALAMFASSATVIANARRLRSPRCRGAVAAAPGGRVLTPVPIAAARS